MKILRIVSDLYPTVVGGLGLHAHELSKSQAKLGHDVTVITTKTDDQPTYEEIDGYKIIREKTLIRPLGNAIPPRLAPDLMRQWNDFDIVHAHSHLSFSTNISAAIRRKKKTPLIITNHGIMSQTAPKGLQELYMPTIAKWTFLSADRIICYTMHEKAEMIKLGIPDKSISVIHNGIDTSLFCPKSLGPRNKYVLWIGRYTPGKGVEYLIDAFAQFKKGHPDISLIMIGRGPEKNTIMERIRLLGLEESITMRDFVPNVELPDIYRNAHAFVLPSLEEGVPRSILEAMACGVPVICTKLPQLVSIVSGAGYIVPLRDPSSIAERLDWLVSDPDVATDFSKEGVKRAQHSFSWDDTVRKTIDIYEQVISVDTPHCAITRSSISHPLNCSNGINLAESPVTDSELPGSSR